MERPSALCVRADAPLRSRSNYRLRSARKCARDRSSGCGGCGGGCVGDRPSGCTQISAAAALSPTLGTRVAQRRAERPKLTCASARVGGGGGGVARRPTRTFRRLLPEADALMCAAHDFVCKQTEANASRGAKMSAPPEVGPSQHRVSSRAPSVIAHVSRVASRRAAHIRRRRRRSCRRSL